MLNSYEDNGGHPLNGANADGVEGFERASHQLRCLIGDPLATIDATLTAAPAMAMAHVLRGWLHLLGTEPDGIAEARASTTAAAPLAGTDRERLHVAALAELVEGRWHRASRVLEDLSIRYPRDALALQAGHQIDFFTGNARLLRDRIARALPAWEPGRPGYHALLGMHAFGLEETGHYAAAERSGREALERESRDSWAWHAVAHVHEMRNDIEAGIGWLGDNEAIWAPDSFLAVHNHWHLSLQHLERDEHDAVLARYDRAIGGPGSTVVLDLIDASAMLWRLQLRGIDVGDRWQAVADRWAPMAEAGLYAFNDLHAVLAFTGAGRGDDQQRVLETQRRLMSADAGADPPDRADKADETRPARLPDKSRPDRADPLRAVPDNRAFTSEVGHPAALAIIAFGAGEHRKAIELLRPLRPIAHRFGGSHAQRDLIDLTLLEAAVRAGDSPLAMALAHERLALRPRDASARRALQRVRT